MSGFDKKYWSEREIEGEQTAISTRWQLSEAERAQIAATGVIHVTQIVPDGCLVPMVLSSVSADELEGELDRLTHEEAKYMKQLADMSVQLVTANWHHSIGLRRRVRAASADLARVRGRQLELNKIYDYLLENGF